MFQLMRQPAERRGVILLVVIVLLTLFAILGIAFVYYAEAQADVSGIYRDAQSVGVTPVADVPPGQLLDEFLRQLIYDVPDDATGVNSALRGHSLARTMYGWDPYIPTQNDKPYSGVGRLHTTTPGGLSGQSNVNGQDDYNLINYMWFRDMDGTGTIPNAPAFTAAQYGFIRDPEHLPPFPGMTPPGNMRNDPTVPYDTSYDPASTNPYHSYVGANGSYTYPDLNNMFLAAVRGDGTVLLPSYWRETTGFSTPGNGCDPYDPTWTSPGTSDVKYRTLRPRPIDQLLSTEAWSSSPPYGPYDNTGTSPVPRSAQVGYFSIPGDQIDTFTGDVGGDVKNLLGGTGYSISGTAPGLNDSIWLDLGSPVRTMPDGTMYKPLYAPLIIDLDSHLNINAHGNMANLRGPSPAASAAAIDHFSNQGWGPWEVNLSKVLTGPNNEWTNLFVGNSGGTVNGRYGVGLGARPTMAIDILMRPGTPQHFYSQMDFDAVDLTQASGPGSPPPDASLPLLDATGTVPWPTYRSNPGGWDNTSTTTVGYELVEHPGLFNYYQPTPPVSGAQPHRTFDASDLRALIRDLSSRTELNSSIVGQLVPNSFNSPPTVQPRLWLTTHSFDVDQPGVTPWLTTDPATVGYASASPVSAPSGTGVGYPDLTNRLQPSGSWLGDNGEFRFTDWRALGAALGKVDLNRPLPPYPSYGSTGSITNASNAAPIVITSAGHGLATNAQVTISGVVGNAAANGTWVITVINPNSFSLTGSSASGTYTLGGTWYAPSSPLTTNYYDRYDDSSNPNAGRIKQAFLNAQAARQQLAQDIYIRLLYATLGLTSNPPWSTGSYQAQNPSNLQALRWLAQLAVNIVDYIDEDDISTPFNFYNDGTNSFWVFGTEMPHLVLNEALGECNRPTAGGPYPNQFWVELYNPFGPFVSSPPPGTNQNDGQPVQLNIPQANAATSIDGLAPTGTAPYPPYQIVIAAQGLTPAQVPTTGLATTGGGPGYDTTTNNNVLGDLWDASSTIGTVIRTEMDVTGTSPSPYLPSSMPYAFPTAYPPGDFDGTNTAPVGSNSTPNVTFRTVGSPSAPPGAPVVPPQSFLLIGPPAVAATSGGPADTANGAIAATAPGATPWIQTPHMTYQATYTVGSPGTFTPPETAVTIALRRLVNPHMPWDPTPTLGTAPNLTPNPYYNPYITVDYLDQVPINNTNTATGGSSTDASIGKRQPYASWFDPTGTAPGSTTSEIVLQDVAPPNPPASSTKNTFGSMNHPVDTGGLPPAGANFSWLVHLDRNLVSPMELLQVSGFQPWQLTHAFIQNKGGLTPWLHCAPWFDEDLPSPGTTSHRLYRALEFFKTHSLAAGVEGTGRIPGKVNLNTLYDEGMTPTGTVFQSVCDPNTSNNFAATDVTTAWNNLQTLRSDEWTPSGTGHPYGSFTAGLDTSGTAPQYPNGTSLDSTLLASIAPGTPRPRILQTATSGNPYLYDQLMSKIANQVTNRSHVFAVYLTVGFFRVLTDPNPALPPGVNTTLPVKLAGEIGARNTPPTNIRHHMFAIVDRSALTQLRIPQAFPSPAQTTATATSIAPAGGQAVTATLPVALLQGTTPGPWQISVGSRVLVDSGNNQEVVTVTAVNSLTSLSSTTTPSFTANFSKAHNGSIAVAVPVEADLDPTSGNIQNITGSPAISGPGSATVTVSPQLPSSIQPNTQLFVDSAPNQEVVTVSSIDTTNNTFTANFARSHLTAPYNLYIPQPNTTTASSVFGSGIYTVTVNALSDADIPSPPQAVAWKIQAGSIITVDTGANQETVQVSAVDTGSRTFTATFNKAHSAGCGVYVPKFANPGPQPNFSAKDNSAVVLYAAVID
jgi:hypothetical protein